MMFRFFFLSPEVLFDEELVDVCCAEAQLWVAAWTCVEVRVATNAMMIYRNFLIGRWGL